MMKNTYFKRIFALLSALILVVALTSCSGDTLDAPLLGTAGEETNVVSTPDEKIDYTVEFDGTKYAASDSSAISVEEATGAILFIKAGVYRLKGHREGQIQVSVSKEQRVTLILDNLTVECKDSAAIYVKSADRVFIEAHEGTENFLSDGTNYALPDYETKPNACIYSSEDLVIRGGGALTVTGNYNNGIGCKNDLLIGSVKLTVSGVNNAVKGNESVSIGNGAQLTVAAAEDAIKSDSVLLDKGFVMISSGAVVSLTCTDDGITGLQSVTVEEGATVQVSCGGSPVNCDGLDGTGGQVNVADGALVK